MSEAKGDGKSEDSAAVDGGFIPYAGDRNDGLGVEEFESVEDDGENDAAVGAADPAAPASNRRRRTVLLPTLLMLPAAAALFSAVGSGLWCSGGGCDGAIIFAARCKDRFCGALDPGRCTNGGQCPRTARLAGVVDVDVVVVVVVIPVLVVAAAVAPYRR